jgi:flavin-binding protein dodecin
MAIAKVIELISEGKSIENALENALKESSKTVKNIKHIYAEGIQAIVNKNKIKTYRINAKVTFIVGK